MSEPSVAHAMPPLLAKAWKWPAIDVTVTSAALLVDTSQFVIELSTSLSALFELVVAATAIDHTGGTPAKMFTRPDGFTVAMSIPVTLAGAVLGYRCGGGFIPTCAEGSAVARIVNEIETTILGAAGRSWPGTGEWTAAPGDAEATPFAVRLEVNSHAFVLTLAIRQPVAAIEVSHETGRAAWTGTLRIALDAMPFAVRAVLHDRMIPLTEALALRVGDVMPIETKRDVSLSLGKHQLARGTITPDDDGGHRIIVAAVGPASVVSTPVTSASTKEQP